MRTLRPAVDHGAAWQVVVVIRGKIVRDSSDATLRELLVRRLLVPPREPDATVDGWNVHARARAGVAVVIAARPGASAARAPEYAEALLDAYAPSPPAPPRIPPAPGGSAGGSGAPALIAAYTPPRLAN